MEKVMECGIREFEYDRNENESEVSYFSYKQMSSLDMTLLLSWKKLYSVE